MKNIDPADTESLERLQKQIDALQNRAQRRELQKMLDAKKAEIAANKPADSTPKADTPEADEPKVESSNIDPKYRKNGDGVNPNEFVRENGNKGKAINDNYVQASMDLRNHYNEAIANGTYVDSYENYVRTMTEGHRIAYGGYDGQHTWYGDVGQGSIDVNPGQIRGEGYMVSNRKTEGQLAETIAKRYGDSYSTNGISRVDSALLS